MKYETVNYISILELHLTIFVANISHYFLSVFVAQGALSSMYAHVSPKTSLGEALFAFLILRKTKNALIN